MYIVNIKTEDTCIDLAGTSTERAPFQEKSDLWPLSYHGRCGFNHVPGGTWEWYFC